MLYSDPAEYAIIVKELVKAYGHPTDGANMISDPNFPFKGVSHCEAVLACLHHLTRSGEPVDTVYPLSPFAQLYIDSLQSMVQQDVLDQLKNAFPLIAPSKRCCLVCAAIQYELSLLSGRSGDYLIYSKHAHIYACALPPGLPSVVREHLIRRFDNTLRKGLDEVKLSLSDCSAESSALSPTLLHDDTSPYVDTPEFCI